MLLSSPRIGHFNDAFRENIKGHTFNHQATEDWRSEISDSANAGKQLLAGSSGSDRRRNIYVSMIRLKVLIMSSVMIVITLMGSDEIIE